MAELAGAGDGSGDLLPRGRRVNIRRIYDWHDHGRVMAAGRCWFETHTVWYVLSRPLLFGL